MKTKNQRYFNNFTSEKMKKKMDSSKCTTFNIHWKFIFTSNIRRRLFFSTPSIDVEFDGMWMQWHMHKSNVWKEYVGMWADGEMEFWRTSLGGFAFVFPMDSSFSNILDHQPVASAALFAIEGKGISQPLDLRNSKNVKIFAGSIECSFISVRFLCVYSVYRSCCECIHADRP